MLRKLFRYFSKNIKPGDEINNHLVFWYKTRRKYLKVNAKVEVPAGFALVVVVNGKISDVLSMGTHRINGSTMPEAFQKLKLGKPTKRGNYKKKFKAEVYYVNLKTFSNFDYTSEDPFHLRSDKFGRIKGYCEGVCDLNIQSAEDVVKYLLRYVSVIKPHVAKKLISTLVGNNVNKVLEKSKRNFSSVLLNPESLNENFNPAVSENLSEYGIEVNNVKLVSLKLTKKVQKKVNEFLSNRANFNSQDNEFTIDTATEIAKIEKALEPELAMFEVGKNELKEEQAEVSESVENETVNKQVSFTQKQPSSEPAPINPLLQKRFKDTTVLSGQNPLADKFANNVTNLNATEFLNENSNNLKQCKYCSATIEMHYKFCPKCGFKQA